MLMLGLFADLIFRLTHRSFQTYADLGRYTAATYCTTKMASVTVVDEMVSLSPHVEVHIVKLDLVNQWSS